MENSILSIGVLISSYLVVQTACDQVVPNPSNTTVKPVVTTSVNPEYQDTDVMYRNILQQTIELLWLQQAHMIRLKVWESRIRRKTKQSIAPMQDIIVDVKTLIREELRIQSERFWNPRPNQLQLLPMLPTAVEEFVGHWKKLDTLVDTDLQSRENVEQECKEIKEEIREALANLSTLYEEVKQQMNILEQVRNDTLLYGKMW